MSVLKYFPLTNMTSAANLYEQLMKKLKENGYMSAFGHPIAEEAWDLFLKHGVFEGLELVDAVTVDISSDNLNLIEDPAKVTTSIVVLI